MAQESKKKQGASDEDERSESDVASESSSVADDAPASAKGGEAMRVAGEEALATTESDEAASERHENNEEDGASESPEDADEEEQAAAQLGSDRYVLAGFFAAGMLGAYVLGRAIQSAWISASNKDWFAQSLPRLAAVPDDDKGMYGIILGGVVALFTVYRTYKKPEVREWSDEVAAELAKVVWPSRKEVTSSTFIVIVASAAATIYLALLDRLWAFVTNIVYGDGS
jgi:preprotein translocase subunit SecE